MYQVLIGSIILCVILIIALIIRNLSVKKRWMNDLQGRDNTINVLHGRIDEFKTAIRRLSKFQSCLDAEETAKSIIDQAEKDAAELIQQSDRRLQQSESKSCELEAKAKQLLAEAEITVQDMILQAKSEASDIISAAKEKRVKSQQETDEALSSALSKAKDIVSDAENKAKSIMGEAYTASKDLVFYQQALASIKNIINGYGFAYMKPLESVLDGLAEDYSFTEAGKELATARAVAKNMISEGLAAKCDYVENYRRETAIAFVLDAFNGKVDSILSLIKKDNYGILEQKIKDAFATVNLLGKPFRNAQITEQYLDARLAELKWAVSVMAIKYREREEQRILKEQMREEERARREYERAIRDAEKQEATIRKAIEKATALLAKANEEQKLKYEAQLIELQSQLEEAESRNQRAMSMAQQTKSGHVYIISNIGSFGESIYKIGMTRRLEPHDRVRELGDASVPFPFDVHAMIFSEDAPALETELHKLFAASQVNKVNPRKEFFRLKLTELQDYFLGKNVEVQWTVKAEAAQYRETLALEEAFKRDEHLKAQWVRHQDKELESMKYIDDDSEEE